MVLATREGSASSWIIDRRKEVTGTVRDMVSTMHDRPATAEQVRAHAVALQDAARAADVSDVRLLEDGTLVVHTSQGSYRPIMAFARRARDVVGCYVNVISDTVPDAEGAAAL